MTLDRDPNHVFRDFVIDGLPSSGSWNPRKLEIRQLLTEWWQTLIALVADAGGLELPNLLIRYEVTGGDENNIIAEANLPVQSGPGVAVFSIVIEKANTGPVTINGKPLLSNTGNPLVAGALAADGIYLFLDNGDSYRLLSDYVSSSIVAAAEAVLDEFSGRYLGAYAAAPAGTLAGQMYFNTTTNVMMVYDGESWAPVASGVITANERQKLSSVVYQPAVEPALDFVMSDQAAFLPGWFSRASGGTYFGADGTLKLAGSNEPRIEYDPATGELLGLLIEEQRTNLVRYSHAFENAAWSKTRVSVTPASIPSPTGVAYHVTDTTENNTHLLIQTLLSWVGNTDYCRWVIAKSDGSGKRLRLYTPTFANWVASGNVIFNLETGTIVSSSLPNGVSSGYGMTPLGDGWHLCWIWSKTIAAPTGSHSFALQLEAANGATTYEGDGLTGFYLAASQVEIGKYPTSYIPTEGAAVTRAPDILTVPLNAINFKRWVGTIFADFRSYRPPSAYSDVNDRAAIWSISDKDSASGDNSLDLLYSNQLLLLSRIDGASYVSSNIGAQPGVPAYEKVAVAFRGSEAKVSRNGGSVTNQTVGFRLEPITLLRVGNDSANRVGNRALKGHMRRITYYPAFLSDADLKALTA